MRIGQKTEAKLRSLCFVGTCALLSFSLSHCKSTEKQDTSPERSGPAPENTSAPTASGTSTPAQNSEPQAPAPLQAPANSPALKLTPAPKPPVAVAAIELKAVLNALLKVSSPLRLTKENLRELQGNSTAVPLVETDRDEQLLLFPANSAGIQSDSLVYQRRFTPGSRFSLFMHSNDKSTQDSEIIRTIPTVFDAAVFCPLTQEILFQAPPTDEHGKFLTEGRPRRVYLFSLKAGTLELVWRRDKQRVGTLSPRMSATPDCQHVLVNLELENGAARIPYGELIYLRRPAPKLGKDGKPKAEPEVDWSFVTLAESGKNGATKHYGEALFVQPPDPKLYKVSAIPPQVFAVLSMVDKENSPTLYTFQPSGNAKTKVAGGIRWARTKIKADRNLRQILQSVSVNTADRVAVLYESREENKNGHFKRGIATLEISNAEAGLKPIFVSDDYSVRSFSVAPQGDRLAASFVESKSSAEVAALADKRTAGVFELDLQNNSPTFTVLERMLPFHGLSSHHNPRPQYSADGSALVYGVPEIPDAEPALFELDTNSNRELQFPVKLFTKSIP